MKIYGVDVDFAKQSIYEAFSDQIMSDCAQPPELLEHFHDVL